MTATSPAPRTSAPVSTPPAPVGATTQLLLAPNTTTTPRARRGAAAVIAQYIQDLTNPSDPAPCAAAA